MNETNTSEVARLRDQIRLEYEASQRVFTDFTPTAKHDYITKRQEMIAVYFEELQHYMTPLEAAAIIAQALSEAQIIASSPCNTS